MINKRLLSLVAAGILVLGLSSLAMAGIPDPAASTASSGTGCIDITPGGKPGEATTPCIRQPQLELTGG